MEMLPDSPTSPAGVLAGARESVAALTETLWAAARPEDLLDAKVELERLRSVVAAVDAQVAAEVEATEAAKTAGWVSPGDYLTSVSGGRRGHGQRLLRTARGLCGSRTATLLALTAGDVSPEHAEVIVAVIDRLPVDSGLRDEAERVLLDQAASLNASELRKAGDHLLEVLDPDGTARAEEAALDRLERSAHLGRFLTIADDGLGGVRVRGRGTVEDAAIIKTALHALAAPLPGTDPDCGEAGRDLRDHGARTWDALVETCLEGPGGRGAAAGAARRQAAAHRHGRRSTSSGTALGAATLDTGDDLSITADPPAGLRRRGDPGRARLARRGPRRRPHPAPGHRRDLESTRAPRRSTAGSPAAAANRSPATPTTFSTGPTAATPHSTTSCCSAGRTTPSCTRHPGRSGSTRSTAGPSSTRHQADIGRRTDGSELEDHATQVDRVCPIPGQVNTGGPTPVETPLASPRVQ